jgi:Ca2+-binding RTX toxin-like protein
VTLSSPTLNAAVSYTGIERLQLDGRAGNDTYAIPSLPLPVTIVDSGGTGDTLDFSQAATGVTVNLASTAAQRIFGGTIALTLQAAPMENVIGTPFNDTITGNGRANRIFGGDGNDVLNGGGGNDLIFGGLGIDALQGGAGNDVLVGGAGNDVLRTGNGRNVLIGGLGADDIRGAGGSDLLIGSRTIYDESEADLLAILAEWASARMIDARIANLTNGLGATQSPFLRPGQSVLDDDTADSLFGGLGADWFLFFPGDNVLDRVAADRPVA